VEASDPRHSARLLRPRCERRRHRGGSEKPDEFAPSHSITWSASSQFDSPRAADALAQLLPTGRCRRA